MRILLSDASVLLNLLAADCLIELGSENGWEIAVCDSVKDEVKKLRDPMTGKMVPVDLKPYFDAHQLRLLNIHSENEASIFVQMAQIVDDGEAMSIAIAACQGTELAMDDKKAIRHVQTRFPTIPIWTTPDLLKLWAETSAVSTSNLQDAIHSIEGKARYFPPRNHKLAEWWYRAKGT